MKRNVGTKDFRYPGKAGQTMLHNTRATNTQRRLSRNGRPSDAVWFRGAVRTYFEQYKEQQPRDMAEPLRMNACSSENALAGKAVGHGKQVIGGRRLVSGLATGLWRTRPFQFILLFCIVCFIFVFLCNNNS